MTRRRRTPIETLVIASAVTAGIVIGVKLVAHRWSPEAERRQVRHLPDLALRNATPDQLATAGYQLGPSSPTSWSDISIRLFEDQRGSLNLLCCRIDGEEAARMVTFPPGSRTPAEGLPPADWPRGEGPEDPFFVPGWWQPTGSQSRQFEELRPDGTARGMYAAYDPETMRLHVWLWTRAALRLDRPSVLDHLIADELAQGFADLALQADWPHDADGWFVRSGLSRLECGPLASRLPDGIERIDTAFLPRQGKHRYLFRLAGIDRLGVARLLAGFPMRTLPEGSSLPDWTEALPAGVRPAWFTLATGARWSHVLMTIGTGRVESARWAAYDPEGQVLLIWDWGGNPDQ